MKAIIAAVALLLSSSAFAAGGVAQDIQFYRSNCRDMAGMSAAAFNSKSQGTTKARLEEIAGDMLQHPSRGPLIRFAIDYGYDKAIDARDAWEASFAYCLDNL